MLDAFNFIDAFIWFHGYAPSLAEIAEGCGVKNRASAGRLLDGIEERGWVRRLPGKARAIEPIVRVTRFFPPERIPHLGAVR
jgi:repressor LexA